MPVLTEEAVIATSAVKNRQIIITILRRRLIGVFRIAISSAARTKPPANTVSGQTIIIPF